MVAGKVVVVFSSSAVISLAYDATGIWNYSEHDPQTTCPDEYVLEDGKMGIFQTGSTFLVVDDDCGDCSGEWNISVTKVIFERIGASPGIPLLLLDE
jgi:hypothetical protein